MLRLVAEPLCQPVGCLRQTSVSGSRGRDVCSRAWAVGFSGAVQPANATDAGLGVGGLRVRRRDRSFALVVFTGPAPLIGHPLHGPSCCAQLRSRRASPSGALVRRPARVLVVAAFPLALRRVGVSGAVQPANATDQGPERSCLAWTSVVILHHVKPLAWPLAADWQSIMQLDLSLNRT